jgi:hypothetical protein
VAVYVVAGVQHKNNFHCMYLLIYRYDQMRSSNAHELLRNFVVINFCCIKFLYTFAEAYNRCTCVKRGCNGQVQLNGRW